jgi:hypothetical protein
MSSDFMDKIKKLPLDKQREMEDFLDYLITKYTRKSEGPVYVASNRKENLGWASGKVWISADFDKTPEDFKDYM